MEQVSSFALLFNMAVFLPSFIIIWIVYSVTSGYARIIVQYFGFLFLFFVYASVNSLVAFVLLFAQLAVWIGAVLDTAKDRIVQRADD